jgi:hypothetical protein
MQSPKAPADAQTDHSKALARLVQKVADDFAEKRNLPPPRVSFKLTLERDDQRLQETGEIRGTIECTIPPPRIRFSIPIRLKSTLNANLGNSKWAAIQKAKEYAAQKSTARIHTMGALARARVTPRDLLPAVVRFTRLSAGRLDDDNLAAAFKRIRDGVALVLGVDDGGPFVRFEYAQKKGPPKVHAIMIEIWRQ